MRPSQVLGQGPKGNRVAAGRGKATLVISTRTVSQHGTEWSIKSRLVLPVQVSYRQPNPRSGSCLYSGLDLIMSRIIWIRPKSWVVSR